MAKPSKTEGISRLASIPAPIRMLDLVQKSGIQETGIDCRTADDTHAFYSEFRSEDLAGTYEIDPFFSAGNP